MLSVFAFFLLLGATAGAHRIYNYESLFAPVRKLVGDRWWLKPVWCAKCNPIWIALSLLLCFDYIPDPWRSFIIVPLAIYPGVRALSWVYVYAARLVPVPAQAPAPTVVPEPACTTCEAGQKAAEVTQVEQHKNLSYKQRVVLMTPMLDDLLPDDPQSSVILEQARSLAADGTWLVQIWLTADGYTAPADLPPNVEIKRVLPSVAFADVVDESAKNAFFGRILPHMLVLGNATIITHDLLFKPRYLTIAAAIHENLGGIAGFRWFHVCHGIPPETRPTDPQLIYRTSLPAGHDLICLSESLVAPFAAYYAIDPKRVTCIPTKAS